MKFKFKFFAKIEVVATEIVLASFSYGVGRILRRFAWGLVRQREQRTRKLTRSTSSLRFPKLP